MQDLNTIALTVRKDILRMSYNAKSAHVGGALSCVEILVALYFKILRLNPENPEGADRDRLVFSKAHDGKVLFSVLCRRGFFDEEVLKGL